MSIVAGRRVLCPDPKRPVGAVMDGVDLVSTFSGLDFGLVDLRFDPGPPDEAMGIPMNFRVTTLGARDNVNAVWAAVVGFISHGILAQRTRVVDTASPAIVFCVKFFGDFLGERSYIDA